VAVQHAERVAHRRPDLAIGLAMRLALRHACPLLQDDVPAVPRGSWTSDQRSAGTRAGRRRAIAKKASGPALS
jgi:hypothetical protein